VHTVVVTAANVADVTKTAQLLHGQERQVHADAGYTGVEKRAEIVALERPIDWQIAGKRSVLKALAEGAEKEALKAVEKAKASARAFVEHPFHIVKNLFGHRKVGIGDWPRTGINSTCSLVWPTLCSAPEHGSRGKQQRMPAATPAQKSGSTPAQNPAGGIRASA
jgi:IS5 family transposase